MMQNSFGDISLLDYTSNMLFMSFSSPAPYLQNVVAAGQLTVPVLVILTSKLKISPGLQLMTSKTDVILA
jgi:hypothetical protein